MTQTWTQGGLSSLGSLSSLLVQPGSRGCHAHALRHTCAVPTLVTGGPLTQEYISGRP